MLMFNLARYIDHYSETSESLWECYRDEPITNDAGVSKSFNFKEKNNRTSKQYW